MSKALITFVKAPVAGTVKTRLQADMGAEKTVAIYTSFVKEVLSKGSRIKDIDRFLGCAPSTSHPFLREMADRHHMQRFVQRGNTLGKRIFNAFRYCARKGYSEMVLIGSDSPSMPPVFIRKAFSALKNHDLVIGPCFDLGLYLIGLTSRSLPKAARHINIDTGEDVSGILATAASRKIRCHMLPFWYDIDTIDNYRFLQSHLQFLNKRLTL